MLKSVKVFLASTPLRLIVRKLLNKIFHIKIPGLKKWQQHLHDKQGIEIGGPSALFNPAGYLPVYNIINSLDGVNFSTSTVWEGKLTEGNNFRYHNKTGHQFIAEGRHLPGIPDDTYDFLLSCNNLEHMANPIAALLEWRRIIKNGGALLLILPNKVSNFDHKRPYTGFDHLLKDYTNNTGEDDLTHLEEILELHDLSRDLQARPHSFFKERCHNNFTNRCLHHHVFNEDLIRQMMNYCKLEMKLFHVTEACYYALAIKN